MIRFSSIILIVFLLGIISCKKKKGDEVITPSQLEQLAKCPLLKVNGANGKSVSSFEYTLGRIKRIISNDSVEVATTFSYNIKNQIEKMVIEIDNAGSQYTVLYQYDATGKIIKTRTLVKEYEYMTNDFIYSGNNITTINSSFDIFGFKVKGVSRVEYKGENVSKVYTKIEGYPELLAYEGTSYDTKPQIYPDGYRTLSLGFVGIANSFFGFFGKNNPTAIKIYDDNGKLDESAELLYEYNKNGFPIKSTKTVMKANVKTSVVVNYQYSCN